MHACALFQGRTFSCMRYEALFPQLSSMIDHAWRWASSNGRLQKNEVNGAEYATLPVDSVRFKTNEAKSSLSVQSHAAFQDLLTLHVHKCMCVRRWYSCHAWDVKQYMLSY